MGPIKYLMVAGMFAACSVSTEAASLNIGGVGVGVTNGIVKVHGDHRYCARGRNGIWHRHNRYGERRPCREWRGEGRRPDSCVKFGPVWFCDY
jgi:hypothetical protein